MLPPQIVKVHVVHQRTLHTGIGDFSSFTGHVLWALILKNELVRVKMQHRGIRIKLGHCVHHVVVHFSHKNCPPARDEGKGKQQVAKPQ